MPTTALKDDNRSVALCRQPLHHVYDVDLVLGTSLMTMTGALRFSVAHTGGPSLPVPHWTTLDVLQRWLTEPGELLVYRDNEHISLARPDKLLSSGSLHVEAVMAVLIDQGVQAVCALQ